MSQLQQSLYDRFIAALPQVEAPQQKKVDFTAKLKWTLIVLVAYFILRNIPLFGMNPGGMQQFQQLSVLLGAEFGSLLSLGIGPIVTASIILQLLNGSGILKFDTTTAAGKARFQGTNKLFSYIFLIFESFVFVFMGGFRPIETLESSLYFTMQLVLVLQLVLGGFIIILLDDLVSKWGLGSGISLFIAAGVASELFLRLFSPFSPPGGASGYSVGVIPSLFQALPRGDIATFQSGILSIVATVAIFMLVVYFQSMKVEIPLSFGRVRGYAIRWPLNFLYTSNTPVILVAALLANVKLFAYFAQSKFGVDANSVANWFSAPQLFKDILDGGFAIGWQPYIHALFFIAIMMIGSLMFSWFWMQTSGMDAHSQAKQIMGSGLQIPGFRNDPRIIEHILNRYIGPLTVMGGLTVGLLASVADISSSLVSGTGLLLAVMIIYRFYEDIARQHLTDMNPLMKKFMGAR